jgi:hypothetical protein
MSKLIRGNAGRLDRYDIASMALLNLSNGWAQIDTWQDASYFGVWTNPARMEIFSYAEGDTCLEKCTDAADYVDAVKRCISFYEHPRQPCRIDVFESRFPEIAKAFRDLGLGEFIH